MKKDNIEVKPANIEQIEAIPRDQRTTEQWETLWNWKFHNPTTLEEKENADKIKKSFEILQKNINETIKALGVEDLPPKEQSAAFINYLKEREEAAAKEQAKLTDKDATPGQFKVPEHIYNACLLKGSIKASDIKGLQPEIERAIVGNNQTLETVFEGVQVTRTEYELLLLIAKLKDEKFISIADKDGAELIKDEKQTLGLTRQIRSVKRILITPYEMAKEYNGGRIPNGAEIEALEIALFKLSEKKQLIRMQKTEFIGKRFYKDKDGELKENTKKTVHEIPFFEELFTIQKTVVTSKTYKSKDLTSETERDAFIIKPSPLFSEQIESFFIPMPNDFRRRNIEAKNNSLAFGKLQAYFIRQIKYGFLKDEILIDNLYLTIAAKDIKSSRLGKAEKDTSKALLTCKNIGLLKSYSIVKNNKGKDKLIYEINKEWL